MAIDITTSHYSDGTATVAGVNVTGQGTAWSKVRKGDRYGTHLGFGVRIAEVIDDAHLTLAYDVPGLYQTEAPYEIQRTPYDLGYLQALQDLVATLGNGNLEAFAGLNGLTDRLPIFSGPGTLALISKLDLSSGLKSDGRAADQAGLVAFDAEDEGFIVRVENYVGGRAALVEKVNNGAPGEWSGPSYITGPAITLDVTEVDEVPYGAPPSVDLTPVDGGYNLAFEIPRGMIIEPGTTTTLPPGSPASVDFVPVTGGYRLDISLPKGPAGDIDGVTPFWVSRLSTDADAGAALTGLGVTPFWQGRITADADAAAARAGLELIKQANATDANAGRVLTVGSFGVGKTAVLETPDLSQVRPTGTYYVSNPTNGPAGVTNGWLEVRDLDAGHSFQTVTNVVNGIRYSNLRLAGVWQGWTRNQLEYGSNPNGRYVRDYSTRMQWCFGRVGPRTVAIATTGTTTGICFSALQTHTYPAAFASSPEVNVMNVAGNLTWTAASGAAPGTSTFSYFLMAPSPEPSRSCVESIHSHGLF